MCEEATCIPRFERASKKLNFEFEKGNLVDDQRAWYVQIDNSWESYFQTLTRNMRQSIHNKANRMKKDGDIEIIHETKFEESSSFWRELVEVDQNSRQYENGTGISSEKNYLFYKNLAQNFSQHGLEMWLLKLNKIPVAFTFSIIFNNKVYGMRWGFNQSYNEYSPAKVLIADMLKDFFEKGYSEYDMQGKFDSFKNKWTDKYRKQTEIMVFNNSLHGKFVHYLKFNLARSRAIAFIKQWTNKPLEPKTDIAISS